MVIESRAELAQRVLTPRVAIYTRVSRDDTGLGKSNERQEEACRLLAQMREWDVVATERDVSKSAYDLSAARPGWDRVEDLMRSGSVDIVVAWKLDRVTRRVSGLVDLTLLCQETGTLFATTDGMLDLTSPTGKAVATILASVAQMEVELKAERQKLANQQRRSNGEPWKSGWRSFGYTLDGEVIEAEAALIRQAAADVLTGTPLREIARRWRAVGMSTPRSEKGVEGWTHNGVKSILLNPKNAAFATYHGEVIGDGKWEAIIDRETHALLVAKLTDPARNASGNNVGRMPANLLSGIATCAVCEAPVTARTMPIQQQKDGKRVTVGRRPIYSCPGYHIALDREKVDNLVVNTFCMAVGVMLPGIVLSIPKRGQETGVMQALDAEQSKLGELADSYSAGRIPLRVLESASADIQKRITALEASVHADADYDPRKLNAESMQNFRDLDVEGQRAILRRVTRISLGRKQKGQRVLDCIGMDVKTTNPATGTVKWIPNLTLADTPYEGTNAPLADCLVKEQPAGIDTLAKAAEWLAESGKTDKRPSGLASKLSPLIRFDRDTGAWVRKPPATA